ncbi:hypothetical protein COLO4_34133 [Corchorus olitorius]|uniref:Uncharacterized protein n=1 Tax=Corchorus olitorius TaxID=93759 RepID=A0A1R3GNG6_9ROSI|nr:hypothetical protein COLO4_34133 [Corchorus olitorius]
MATTTLNFISVEPSSSGDSSLFSKPEPLLTTQPQRRCNLNR